LLVGKGAQVRGASPVKLPRRQFLHLAAGAATLSAVSRIAWTQGYPTRPVRWIVGFPPGGPNDITARIMAEFLSERLHQQFAVENRPGAAGNIATESLARSQPERRSTKISIMTSSVTLCSLPVSAKGRLSWR
jgi:tripartite-type tricarboxylate transporter receptor subunit TctC